MKIVFDGHLLYTAIALTLDLGNRSIIERAMMDDDDEEGEN